MGSGEESVRTFFDDPRNYLQSSSAMIALRTQLARELLGELHGCSILDVGCGNGAVSVQFLASNHVVFLDLSPVMISEARRLTPLELLPRAEFVCANFLEHDVGRQFDIVIGIGILAHVADACQAIDRLGRLVRPGGSCLVQFTDADVLTSSVYASYGHLRDWVKGTARPYALTSIGMSQVLEKFTAVGFSLAAMRRHWRLGPIRNVLSSNLCYKLLAASSRGPLQKLGGETLLLFTKTRLG